MFAGDERRLVPRSDVFPGDWQQIAQHCEERTIKHLVERSLGRGREGVGIDVDGVIHQHEYQPLFTPITSTNTRGCAGAGSAFVKSDMSVTVDEADDDIVVHRLKAIGGCNEQSGGTDRADQTPQRFFLCVSFLKKWKNTFPLLHTILPWMLSCYFWGGSSVTQHLGSENRTQSEATFIFRLEPGTSAG